MSRLNGAWEAGPIRSPAGVPGGSGSLLDVSRPPFRCSDKLHEPEPREPDGSERRSSTARWVHFVCVAFNLISFFSSGVVAEILKVKRW